MNYCRVLFTGGKTSKVAEELARAAEFATQLKPGVSP